MVLSSAALAADAPATPAPATATPAATDAAAKPESAIQRASYGFGMGIGMQMKQEGLELDIAQFVRGISDALAGRQPVLTQEEIQQAVMAIQEETMKKRAADGDNNQKAADAFLAENAKKEGVKTTASGLQYIVVKEGEGKTPTPSDFVEVHYRGTLLSGKEFDSSIQRGKPAQFKLDGVIPGWTEGLQLMKEGGKMKFYIPPKIGYGQRGAGNIIPANSLLVFDVELLKVLGPNDPNAAPEAAEAPHAPETPEAGK
ncbi:MAG: FKBP-type peptidyl-prolyl cis-trans isomerase [Phycisphaeraceae bacterium]|nr:FKBP-type peptidyl-prolyl cis-trans isomerase [Phycisphaeraceae bacterium]